MFIFKFHERSCHNIPKISPWGLFLEGLKTLQREICISKLVGLALQLKVNLFFALFYFLFEGNGPNTSSQRYLEGRFNWWFLALPPWGADLWRGLFSELFSTFCSQDKHCLNMMMICYSRNYTWPKQRKQLFALPQ